MAATSIGEKLINLHRSKVPDENPAIAPGREKQAHRRSWLVCPEMIKLYIKIRKMKIRIKGNTVRYRLTRSEVRKLATAGRIEEYTDFAEKSFIYAIEATNNDKLSIDFSENRIVVRMPKRMIDELAHTDKVGFSGSDGRVVLLVEKDFVCTDNTEEDQSDNYPNPNCVN